MPRRRSHRATQRRRKTTGGRRRGRRAVVGGKWTRARKYGKYGVGLGVLGAGGLYAADRYFRNRPSQIINIGENPRKRWIQERSQHWTATQVNALLKKIDTIREPHRSMILNNLWKNYLTMQLVIGVIKEVPIDDAPDWNDKAWTESFFMKISNFDAKHVDKETGMKIIPRNIILNQAAIELKNPPNSMNTLSGSSAGQSSSQGSSEFF
jgi:hypothetical protein